MTRILGLAAGLLMAARPRTRRAFPAKPVTLIVPWPAGGSTTSISASSARSRRATSASRW
jgi:tripartite-type tricarboxylate transporter receptor subunit TctC